MELDLTRLFDFQLIIFNFREIRKDKERRKKENDGPNGGCFKFCCLL